MNTNPFSALHSRVAFSISVSSTGSRSKVVRLIALSTSAVAVCCSSASFVSLNRRTFWIAIAAWSPKVRSRAISRSLNGRTSVRRSRIVPKGLPSRKRGVTTTVR
jgi:hypothetical protein